MPAGSRAVLAGAHEEVQDGDIVVAEDAADDEANEEDDADEDLLVEKFDADEGAVVEHAGAPAGGASNWSPTEVPRRATILSTLEKVMALRLVYDRVP